MNYWCFLCWFPLNRKLYLTPRANCKYWNYLTLSVMIKQLCLQTCLSRYSIFYVSYTILTGLQIILLNWKLNLQSLIQHAWNILCRDCTRTVEKVLKGAENRGGYLKNVKRKVCYTLRLKNLVRKPFKRPCY